MTRTLRRRRRAGLLAGLVLVAAAGGAVWVVLDPLGAPSPDGADDAPGGVAAFDEALGEPRTYDEDRATADAAADLLDGLESDDDLAAATSAGTLAELEDQGAGVSGALPPGTRMRALPDTWARQGNVAAMAVEVTPPGATAPDVFVVWLVRADATSGWEIAMTDPIPDGGAGA